LDALYLVQKTSGKTMISQAMIDEEEKKHLSSVEIQNNIGLEEDEDSHQAASDL
jgi:hypothetical protein